MSTRNPQAVYDDGSLGDVFIFASPAQEGGLK